MEIESLCNAIILATTTPATYRRLTFEAMCDRTSLGARVDPAVVKGVLGGSIRTHGEETVMIENYRTTVSRIFETYPGSLNALTPQTLDGFSASLGKHLRKKHPWMQLDTPDLQQTLSWVADLTDHALVKSAILYGCISSQHNDLPLSPIGIMCAYAELSRWGLDARKLLVIERALGIKQKEKTALDSMVSETGNYSSWIETFIEKTGREMQDILTKIQSSSAIAPPAFFSLSDRERQIVGMGDAPSVRLTNKKIAQHFRISQITASRSLSRLTRLGLLMTHGKGRSVYYTRL